MSPSTTLFIRATGDPIAVLPAVRAAVHRLEPHAVLYEIRTLSHIAEESAAAIGLAMRLLFVLCVDRPAACGRRCLRDDGVPRATSHA